MTHSSSEKSTLLRLVERLAAMLDSENGAQILGQLQQISQVAQAESTLETPQPPTGEQLGVWELVSADNTNPNFRRTTKSFDQWRCWADIECLPAKGARVRIAFLGESVARGYLFDPAYTPAHVIQSALDQAYPGRYEVLDLARIDITAHELLPLIEAVQLLQPDIVIMFAGNNWDNVRPTFQQQSILASMLRHGGYTAVRDYTINEILEADCFRVASKLGELQRRNCHVIVVVPEFNLLDWRCDPNVSCPVSATVDQAQWEKLCHDCEMAFVAGDIETLFQLGQTMVSMDQGTSSTAFYHLARASLYQQDFRSARRYLELARDAIVGMYIPHSPRCHATVRQNLLKFAGEFRLAVVDLPSVFSQCFPDSIPDRRLFMDYCHLSEVGIKLCCESICRAILKVDRQVDVDLKMESPEPEVLASAHFLAALHNAHYGQADEIIRYHLGRALQHSPSIASAIRIYMQMQPSPTVNWMHQGYHEISKSRLLNRYLTPHVPRMIDKLADYRLLQVMDEMIGTNQPASRQHLDCSMIVASIDLLKPEHFATSFLQRRGYSSGPVRAALRCWTRSCRFFWVPSAHASIQLRITARLPRGFELLDATPESSKICLRLNGQDLGQYCVSHRWASYHVAIPREMIGADLNELEIVWPKTRPDVSMVLETAAQTIERGGVPDTLPIWGEIDVLKLDPITSTTSKAS
jgi:hypothetical protein